MRSHNNNGLYAKNGRLELCFPAFSLIVLLALFLTSERVFADLRETAELELNTPPKSSEQRSTKSNISTSDSYMIARPQTLNTTVPSAKWTFLVGVENLSPQGSVKSAGLSDFSFNNFEDKAAVLGRLNLWTYFKKTNLSIFAEFSWQHRNYDLKLPGILKPQSAELDVIRTQLGVLSLFKVKHFARQNIKISAGLSGAYGKLFQLQSSRNSTLLNVSNNLVFWEFGPHIETNIAQRFFVDLSFKYRTGNNYERTLHGLLAAGMPF